MYGSASVCKDLGISKTAMQVWVRDDRFRSHEMTPTADPDERREMDGGAQADQGARDGE